MTTVTELVTKFSFVGNLQPLTKFNAGLARGISLVGGMGAAVSGATFLLGRWTSGVLSAQEALARLSQDSEVSLGYIQEMGFAAGQTGSSVEALQGTISSLSRKIGQAAISGSSDFSRLGISIRDSTGQLKTADQILDEVASRFKTMNLSLQQQRTLSSALGIDASLIRLLRLSSGELSSLREEARRYNLMTEEQSEQVIAYNRAIDRLRFRFDSLKRTIALGVAPALTDLSVRMGNFFDEHSENIARFVSGTVDVFAGIVDTLGGVIPVFAGITAAVSALTIALKFAASPAGELALILTGLYLVYDDLKAFYSGRDSLAGAFVPARGAAADTLFPSDGGEVFKEGEGFWSRFWKVLQITGDETSGTAGLRPNGGIADIGGRSVTQDINIDVRTDDPQRAADIIADKLREHLDDAQLQTVGVGR